ncbi:MAG: hypothetical protein CLLPBCKN_008209 [Chroococcidiopsis cubana SAG 39.79]|nr:hypothetical protein [Chroococcidiopsis cubana SAG 39.79]
MTNYQLPTTNYQLPTTNQNVPQNPPLEAISELSGAAS